MNSINSRYIFRNRILSRKWDLWWRVSKLSNKILAMHIFDSNSTVLKKFEKKSSVWKIEFYFCFINVFRGSRRIRSEDKNSKKKGWVLVFEIILQRWLNCTIVNFREQCVPKLTSISSKLRHFDVKKIYFCASRATRNKNVKLPSKHNFWNETCAS